MKVTQVKTNVLDLCDKSRRTDLGADLFVALHLSGQVPAPDITRDRFPDGTGPPIRPPIYAPQSQRQK